MCHSPAALIKMVVTESDESQDVNLSELAIIALSFQPSHPPTRLPPTLTIL